MTRKHEAAPERAVHHERASIAVRLERAIKRATKPARLMWLARQQRNVDEHMSDLALSREWLSAAMARTQDERVRLAAKYMAVERGLS